MRQNYLKEWRVHRGLSIAAVAELLNTTRQQVYNIEDKSRDLRQHWVDRLAKIYDISPEQLTSAPPNYEQADPQVDDSDVSTLSTTILTEVLTDLSKGLTAMGFKLPPPDIFAKITAGYYDIAFQAHTGQISAAEIAKRSRDLNNQLLRLAKH